MARQSSETLDEVLSLQLLLAWAGETAGGDNRRLSWWRTDLVDELGGHDLMRRLLKRTHRWAVLAAARMAAKALDHRRRVDAGNADGRYTLFHVGWEDDEALEERLTHQIHSGKSPSEALPLLAMLERPFERADLERLVLPTPTFKTEPGGRQLRPVPGETHVARARRLAAALLAEPHVAEYPTAFLLLEADSA